MSNATKLINQTRLASRTDLVGEVLLVIEKALGPVHQRVDIFWRGQFRGPFVLYAVFPEIFVSVQTTVSTLITHRLSDEYLGPADMIGHYDGAGTFNKVDLRYDNIERGRTSWGVQNSVIVP